MSNWSYYTLQRAQVRVTVETFLLSTLNRPTLDLIDFPLFSDSHDGVPGSAQPAVLSFWLVETLSCYGMSGKQVCCQALEINTSVHVKQSQICTLETLSLVSIPLFGNLSPRPLRACVWQSTKDRCQATTPGNTVSGIIYLSFI